MSRDQDAIHQKGFNMFKKGPNQYNELKVGVKTLEDVTLEAFKDYKRHKETHYHFYDVHRIRRALAEKNEHDIRLISEFFYRTNGIYRQICDYYATIYRWDWYISPTFYKRSYREDKSKITEVEDMMYEALDYLDETHIKDVCGMIAHNVIVYGKDYYCIIEGEDGILFQQLPVDRCRIRFRVKNLPVVEFDMAWFDSVFPNPTQRMRVLQAFPEDIQAGYVLFKEHKLDPDETGEIGSWYALEPGTAICFSLMSGGGLPIFASAIPNLIDLDDAIDLDQKRRIQNLLHLIVQEAPRDKNGDLLYDVDELIDLHDNAVGMMGNNAATDILTTPLSVKSIDLSSTSTEDDDSIDTATETVYSMSGITSQLFNSDGNLATQNSIHKDEGVMRDLKLQFEALFDHIIQKKYKHAKAYTYHFYMLDTTQNNYESMSKLYKEQMTVGYSKIMAQIALGHSQSSIINNAYFENDVLDLSTAFLPPMQSSSMSSDDIAAIKGERGRPAKDSTELSDKTLANKESMN